MTKIKKIKKEREKDIKARKMQVVVMKKCT